MWRCARAFLPILVALLCSQDSLAIEGAGLTAPHQLPGKIDGLWTIDGNASQIRITCLLDLSIGPTPRRCQGVITKAVRLTWLRQGDVVFVVDDPVAAEFSQPYLAEPDRASKLQQIRDWRTWGKGRDLGSWKGGEDIVRDAQFIAQNTVDTGKVFSGVEFPGREPGGKNSELFIRVVDHNRLEYWTKGQKPQHLIRAEPVQFTPTP